MQKGSDYTKTFISGDPESTGEAFAYFFRCGIDKEITFEDVQEFENQTFDTFDENKATAFDIWKVKIPANMYDWKNGSCTCPAYDENYICKHLVAFAVEFELIKRPEINYDDRALYPTRRRHPKEAMPALKME